MFVWGAREPPPHWHNLNTAPQLAASGPGATVRGRFDSAEQLLLLNTSTSSTQGQEAGCSRSASMFGYDSGIGCHPAESASRG